MSTHNAVKGLPTFPLQEIGSLPKTLWRLKALTKAGVTDKEIQEAKQDGKRLKIDGHEELLKLLDKKQGFTKDEKFEIKKWASRYTLAYLEDIGLDIVYDGEETRTEMYDYPVARTEGFEQRGWVRSWDHLYFKKAAVVAPPQSEGNYHIAEYHHALEHATKPLKVPVTGAYTIMDWSFDEHYYPRAHGQSEADRRKNARRDFVHDVAKNVLRPNVESLVEAGAPMVQIDEPAATTKPNEIDIFVESFNESTKGIDGTFSVHICFSDYALMFPEVMNLENCQQLLLELSNKDSWGLGRKKADRPGIYETLELWDEYGADFEIGLGVLDVHTDKIEPPELVRDRVLAASDILGPEKVFVNPDCGLRTRRWPVVQKKLESLVEGTKMARQTLEKEQ